MPKTLRRQTIDNFELTINQLTDIAAAFERKTRQGLNEDGKQIKCIPTYIPSIKLPDNGDAWVIDLGGTHVRAAVISFKNGKPFFKRDLCKTAMPWERNTVLDRNIYLDTQSKALESLNFNKACPLGYCFSYPAQSTQDGDAVLLKWTKEIQVPGVVGKKVGSLLLTHIAWNYPNVNCSKVVVMNDTVASLIAGLLMPEVDAYIGLIVGTGTNMATFMDTHHIPKLKESAAPGLLPVNLESGNFFPPHLTKWDEMVDNATQDSGEQRFEKAVSGAYLGNIFKAVYPESDFNANTGAQGIAQLLNSSPKNDAYRLTAEQIYDRSAKLVAASLAGLIKLLNSKKAVKTVRIVAEGSLFWGTIKNENRYLSTAQSTLKQLLNESGLEHIHFEFQHIEDANLIGSAIAALA
ncbi:MAG: hexokinase [Proteobacteria bacterium]|nr:hexokinase [Pseudomonadota bacterium]MBU1386239.1 hexokinase [Pseudomonadota bacterium]